jgi:hypothetical protein
MYTPDAEILWSLRTPRSCRLRKFFKCTHPTLMQAVTCGNFSKIFEREGRVVFFRTLAEERPAEIFSVRASLPRL